MSLDNIFEMADKIAYHSTYKNTIEYCNAFPIINYLMENIENGFCYMSIFDCGEILINNYTEHLNKYTRKNILINKLEKQILQNIICYKTAKLSEKSYNYDYFKKCLMLL